MYTLLLLLLLFFHISGTHKGQVSFPGGHLNNGESAVAAALRETHEELGLNISDMETLGEFQTIPAVTGTAVTPILGYVKSNFDEYSQFNVSTDEVDRVFFRSIDQLVSPGYRTYEVLSHKGKTMKLPTFGGVGHTDTDQSERIWGMTAIILEAVLDRIVLPCLTEQ